MSKDWQGNERRSNPRIPMSRAKSTVETREAAIVDISLSGALLEVSSALPSSAQCVLKLYLDEETLDLSGEVVRSYVHGFDKAGTGLPSVKYRAALKFAEVKDKERAKLEKFLHGRGDGGLRVELST